MGHYLLDTNIVSGYLSLLIPESGLDFIDEIIDDTPRLSVISQIELLSWQTEKSVENKVREFITDSKIYTLEEDIVVECVELRRKHKMKTPDALIAATAIFYKLVLVTNNLKDFSNIKGLKIIDPYHI